MISNVSGTTVSGAAAAESMKQATGMNKDDFLTLFVTQLQNQDPLDPQEGTEFISQLAQLTQVEQAYNTNTNLQSMLNQGGNSMSMAAVSLIGTEVEAIGSEVNLRAGTPTSVNFNLVQSANEVTVSVQDASGATVKTLVGGAKGAGEGSIAWDGTNNAGVALGSGAYTFTVSAKDASGNSVASTSMIKGKVDGVDMSGSTPVLSIGNVRLNLTDVTTVTGGV